jgi:Glycosyl hydrolase family 47
MYVYDNQAFLKNKERWVKAADSTISHLASSPEGHPDITFLGQYDGKSGLLVPKSGHMDCFAGGNFLLGGIALNDTKYTDFGLVNRASRRQTLLICTETDQRMPSHIPLHCDKDWSRKLHVDSIRMRKNDTALEV